nr:unnamed protein product [Callosobruchus analis]
MDNNLLTDIQNEISAIGFDKLKEVHFGVECTSGSESGENDVLDDEYYKYQPPARSYELIKDHIRGAGIPSGYHAPSEASKNENTPNTSSNNHISNRKKDSSKHEKVLGSSYPSGPQPMFPIQSQVFSRGRFITQARVFPDVASQNTFLGSTASLSISRIVPSSDAVKQIPPNCEKASNLYNYSTLASKKDDTETKTGHNLTRKSSLSAICDTRGLIEEGVVQNSYSNNHLGRVADMDDSLAARPLNTPTSVERQILSVCQLLSTYQQRRLVLSRVAQSYLDTQTQLPSERCPASSGSHAINPPFSCYPSDISLAHGRRKRTKNGTPGNSSETKDTVALYNENTCAKPAQEKVVESKRSKDAPKFPTIQTHGHSESNSRSKSGSGPPAFSNFTDIPEVASSSEVRQASRTRKTVRTDTRECIVMEQPCSTHNPEVFLKYIESRLSQSQPKASESPSNYSVSTSTAQVHDHLKNASQNIDGRFENVRKTVDENCPLSNLLSVLLWRTCPMGRENSCEGAAEVPTYNNKPPQTGLISWFGRIFCYAGDTP